MKFLVNKHKFITFDYTYILLLAIIVGSSAVFLVACKSKYESFYTVEVKSLSYFGVDSTDQQDQPNKNKSSKDKEEPIFNNSSDTLLPADHIRLKLEDPDYDVRYEKGSIKPWHEIRSIYLRRQISPSNFAAVDLHSLG